MRAAAVVVIIVIVVTAALTHATISLPLQPLGNVLKHGMWIMKMFQWCICGLLLVLQPWVIRLWNVRISREIAPCEGVGQLLFGLKLALDKLSRTNVITSVVTRRRTCQFIGRLMDVTGAPTSVTLRNSMAENQHKSKHSSNQPQWS